jgi:hypothetical protein
MNDDERCCGTGTCIINPEGYCWCGQKWDGSKMCFPEPKRFSHATPSIEEVDLKTSASSDNR